MKHENDFWRPAPDRALNIAHRGARSLAPENTLPAAARALAEGADFWELDVCLSADGELVVIHDDNLARTSNAALVHPNRAPWLVRDFTLAELKELDFGSWFVETDPFGTVTDGWVSREETGSLTGTRIPALAEALEFSRANDWPVNVEIKNLMDQPGHDAVTGRVVNLIRSLEMVDLVLLSSFNWTYLVQARRLAPELATGVLSAASQPDPVRLVRDLDARTWHPSVKAARREQMAALARAGIPSLIYTVNRPREMARWLKRGAAGLFTDFPQNFPER